ncbi:MAG: DAK2 domain-containing protein, partial [Peptococcaceae bacterium]|nr:DAK2 domain-containing protein [Peptococcaceae bacterium]
MMINGSSAMEQHKDQVDALNVFPVPDGDTGTNMFLTVQSAAREVRALVSPSIAQVADAASMGSLMGARGNSGVILSQLFRGLAKGLEGKDSVTTLDFAVALQQGVDTAYKAVMKPVEGTILTVARATAKEAQSAAKGSSDIIAVLQAALHKGESALAATPEQLPALKQAGVVDAGGQGFLYILGGWLAALSGAQVPVLAVQPVWREQSIIMSPEAIEFQYCTEF